LDAFVRKIFLDSQTSLKEVLILSNIFCKEPAFGAKYTMGDERIGVMDIIHRDI